MNGENESSKLIYGDETFRILGACFEVYKQMGCGFLEAVYVECLRLELVDRDIPTTCQPRFELKYKERPIGHPYIPDLICFDKVVVEVKAVSDLTGAHRAQIINYLRATGLDVGLLVNFGHFPMLEHERFVSRAVM